MQQPRWTWSTLAIVTATVALVFGPVFIPREVARWYLAAAANANRAGDRALGRHYLDRASAWDASLMSDREFWIAQMDRTNSDELLDLLQKAIETDSRGAAVARRVAIVFIDEFDFPRAVRALKMAFPDGQPWNAEDLNLLAYARAQAGVELDQALKDIDKAIETVGNDPGLLDTKAWVLHGMNRDLEALGYANDAIKKMEERMGLADAESSPDKKKDKKTEEPARPAAESSASEPANVDEAEAGDETFESLSGPEQLRKRIQAAKTRLGLEVWNLAVLHFHRLRIYEALRRPDEARQERAWLQERDVPIVDELF